MNIHVRDLTPTQLESMERSKRFHAAIKAKADELTAYVEPASVPAMASVKAAPAVKAIEPEAMPAETDPPREPWFSIIDCVSIKREFPTIASIQKLICGRYKIKHSELLSARRSADLVRPRQIAYYLAKTLTPHSLPEIGRRFGGRDHTSVLHGVRKIAKLIRTDRPISDEIVDLTSILTPAIERSDETEQGVFPGAERESPAPEGEGAGRGRDLRAAEHPPEEAPSLPQRSPAAAPGGQPMTKQTRWANIYKPVIGACGHVYMSRQLADQMAAPGRLACVAFEVELPNEDSTDDERPST